MSEEAGRIMNHLASNPMATSSVTSADLREIMLATEGWIMCRGYARDIKTKKLAPGVYKIWTEARP